MTTFASGAQWRNSFPALTSLRTSDKVFSKDSLIQPQDMTAVFTAAKNSGPGSGSSVFYTWPSQLGVRSGPGWAVCIPVYMYITCHLEQWSEVFQTDNVSGVIMMLHLCLKLIQIVEGNNTASAWPKPFQPRTPGPGCSVGPIIPVLIIPVLIKLWSVMLFNANF